MTNSQRRRADTIAALRLYAFQLLDAAEQAADEGDHHTANLFRSWAAMACRQAEAVAGGGR